MSISMSEASRRSLAALQGLSLGDALGMPTQSMSPDQTAAAYGSIRTLRDAVAYQPIAPSMPAGSVTDDTEQALVVSHLLIEGKGHMAPRSFAEALLAWEDDMIARGSLDLLGPSTKSALERVRNGEDPTTTGTLGTTNGAAMRVTPVGIANDVTVAERFTEAVYESCLVTHDTFQGWESALLVAAAVSFGINGEQTHEAIAKALDFVQRAPRHGVWSAKASVLARARQALDVTRAASRESFADVVRDYVGTSVDATESIPAAFCICEAYAENPFEGLCVAANLGGDTDTIAAIAGAILGASSGPEAFPHAQLERVSAVSGLELASVSEQLVELRCARI
ncbi:MAG: ADP-ribosylglycohydrolase family protein [Ancrocorticia sp.]|nr:ADP-ribosylglycohydrolase family protein [Ancrocorticia sp.]MCI2002067.1 ADP-ribosylglycohydrolase family protein [Ancrocorticia sp.]MCI2012002.1 ADP-ribosylglycohydrolase family protein [Ancrocorticia sp.]MCI2029478.1 ADP-ribosylglycohydrolase family protein [Ancrocorticia sp.]